MNIKINNFNIIPQHIVLNIISEYCEKNQIVHKATNKNILDVFDTYDVKPTSGKFPTIVTYNHRNYHITCRKTQTMLIFTIWLA